MKEEELVKLLDTYMGKDGYYMKPKFEEEAQSFFIAKGDASAKALRESFGSVEKALGDRVDKDIHVFQGQPEVECAVCADVPNLMEVEPPEENNTRK